MGRPLRISVSGMDELRADMRALSEDLTALPTMDTLARRMATLAQGFAPKQSGDLRRSIKPEVSRNRASTVSYLPYAPIQEFGWGRRKIKAHEYMQKADKAVKAEALRDLQATVHDLIAARGLA
jgi:phage gpG-like protein